METLVPPQQWRWRPGPYDYPEKYFPETGGGGLMVGESLEGGVRPPKELVEQQPWQQPWRQQNLH